MLFHRRRYFDSVTNFSPTHHRDTVRYSEPGRRLGWMETSFDKTERTNFSLYMRGHQPALLRCHHLVGISEDAVCRLCGVKIE